MTLLRCLYVYSYIITTLVFWFVSNIHRKLQNLLWYKVKRKLKLDLFSTFPFKNRGIDLCGKKECSSLCKFTSGTSVKSFSLCIVPSRGKVSTMKLQDPTWQFFPYIVMNLSAIHTCFGNISVRVLVCSVSHPLLN